MFSFVIYRLLYILCYVRNDFMHENLDTIFASIVLMLKLYGLEKDSCSQSFYQKKKKKLSCWMYPYQNQGVKRRILCQQSLIFLNRQSLSEHTTPRSWEARGVFLIVVCTLKITTTYQTILQPPGGVHQSNHGNTGSVVMKNVFYTFLSLTTRESLCL